MARHLKEKILNMKKYMLTLIFLINISCMRIYTGSYNQENFTLNQPDELGPVVEKWEDGLRTSGEKGELEWWYFDTKLEDGSLFVCYFYKIHPIKDIYFIGMNYNSIDGQDIFLMKFGLRCEIY